MAPRIELGIRVLQTHALPLGYATMKESTIIPFFYRVNHKLKERKARGELLKKFLSLFISFYPAYPVPLIISSFYFYNPFTLSVNCVIIFVLIVLNYNYVFKIS